MLKTMMVLAATAALVLSAAGSAFGVSHHPETGREFGQHIAHHAMTEGFSGEHNPGTHQGFAGHHHHHDH